MSALYRVTLVQLKVDAAGLGAPTDKIELGQITDEEIFRLAGNLLKVNVANQPKAEPGIIVQRGEKGWRIAVHGGRLCMHKSTSLFDEYWSVDNAPGLAQLAPFKAGAASAVPFTARTAARGKAGGRPSVLRTAFEVTGLFAVGVVLIMVGLFYGLPRHKLSDLPPDVIVVTVDAEKASVFSAVAGSYITGKKPGDSFVTISPEGLVRRGRIGKDGKPAAPDNEEQAVAARKGNLAAVVTKLGVIAEFPPDAVNVGPYRWRRLMTN